MFKNKYVEFTFEGAKIYTNPLKVKKTFLKNPDLSKVSHLPTHYWKLLDNGEIYPMNEIEMLNRDHLLDYLNKIKKQKKNYINYIIFIVGFILGLFSFYLKLKMGAK